MSVLGTASVSVLVLVLVLVFAPAVTLTAAARRTGHDARSTHGKHASEALVEHEPLHRAALLQDPLLVVAERRVAHERDQDARTAPNLVGTWTWTWVGG